VLSRLTPGWFRPPGPTRGVPANGHRPVVEGDLGDSVGRAFERRGDSKVYEPAQLGGDGSKRSALICPLEVRRPVSDRASGLHRDTPLPSEVTEYLKIAVGLPRSSTTLGERVTVTSAVLESIVVSVGTEFTLRSTRPRHTG
jgi:hypothetical protein